MFWSFPTRLPCLAALLALVLAFCSHAYSQTLRVRTVGGRLLVRATLKGPAGEVPTHLIADLGSFESLVLHKNAVEMMGLAQQKTKLLDLAIGDASFKDVVVTQRDDFPEVEDLTREHASELEEVPVSGIIGLGLLPEQAFQLDLPGKVIRIGPIDQMAKSQGNSAVELDCEPTAAGLVFPAELPDGRRLRVQFGTRQYESLAEFDAFDMLKIGRAEPVPVKIGTIDLLHYSAFRPSGLRGIPKPLPDLVLGIQLLKPMRVTVDLQARKIRFEVVGAPEAHAAEQGYFIADSEIDPEAIESFLNANPQSWLVPEAASRLLQLRLKSDKATEASRAKALEFYAASLPADRRAQQMMVIVDQHLSATSARALAVLRKALELAAASAGQDMNAAAVHQINARRGLLAMREGNLAEARRLLLSAAFGMPGDVTINLWLGEFYRLNKQPSRAWSRYVEAALSKEPPVQAFRALEALGADPEFRNTFTAADAELMLEGRLLSFAPPRLREAEEPASVQLVELLTNSSRRNSLGAQLAHDGLRQFYDAGPVVFLSYHLDGSLGNATAAARVKQYGIRSTQAVICDGTPIDSSSRDETAAPTLFEEYLKQIAGPPPKMQLRVESSAEWKGRQLDARINLLIDHPPVTKARELRLFVLLVERCVFALAGNGTGLHYNVVRGSLGPVEGVAVDVATGRQQWDLSINLDDLSPAPATAPSATAPSASEPSTDGPAWMVGPEPDPRECVVAIIVQDLANDRVFTAQLIKPVLPGGAP